MLIPDALKCILKSQKWPSEASKYYHKLVRAKCVRCPSELQTDCVANIVASILTIITFLPEEVDLGS